MRVSYVIPHFTETGRRDSFMSKNNRYSKQYMYNRQSKGFQQNQYKHVMKEKNITAPKAISEKKLRTTAIVVGILWIVATVFLWVYFRWIGLLIGLLIGAAILGGAFFFLRSKQREMITYYKKIGMTEEMYVSEMKKRAKNPKEVDAARKLWNKVEVK